MSTAPPAHATHAAKAGVASITIGVPTTTQLAVYHEGRLELARMNVLAEDGCGVLSAWQPPVGAQVLVTFRLSTSPEQIHCRGHILGHLPTSPAGLELRSRLGAEAYNKAHAALRAAATSAAVADSATAMFRMSDLEAARDKKRAASPKPATTGATPLPAGFSVRFESLSPSDQERVVAHVRFSRRLSEQLAAHGGQMVALGEDERPTLAGYFDEGDLAKKASDW